MATVVLSEIDEGIQTFPPIIALSPTTLFLPRIVVPEYRIASSLIVGWRFLPY
jgi:hypothetical protein